MEIIITTENNYIALFTYLFYFEISFILETHNKQEHPFVIKRPLEQFFRHAFNYFISPVK